MSKNLIMGLGAAMEWSKENNGSYFRESESYGKYQLYLGRLVCSRHEDDSYHDVTTTLELLNANYTPWEEPREHTGYWEAMIAILLEKKEFEADRSAGEHVYYEQDGAVFFRDSFGAKFPHIPSKDALNAKWYEYKPTDLKNESKADDHDTYCNICGATFCMCDNNEYLPKFPIVPTFDKEDNIIGCGADVAPEEPVFNLTYKEALEAAKNGSTVKSESMGPGQSWHKYGAQWRDADNDLVCEVYTLDDAMLSASEKWRIVS
jgi:hypothetical protein